MNEQQAALGTKAVRFAQICIVELDAWNRAHDQDLTMSEARAVQAGGKEKIFTHLSLNDYMYGPGHETAGKRLRALAMAQLAAYYALPLSERLRRQAICELIGALTVHKDNLEEFEAQVAAEMEIELEEEMGVGMF